MKKELFKDNGNHFDYSDNYHYSLKPFETIKSLGFAETKVALRVLKYYLEQNLGFELSDELFEDVFLKIPFLRPLHPLGCGYSGLGYIMPLQKVLEKHHIDKSKYNMILDFFRVHKPDHRRYRSILLHIPHSSDAFPEESKYTWNDLDDEERLLIDYYTDELFIPKDESTQIRSVVFPYCRLYCDTERLINDPLEKEGLGIRYRWGLTEHNERHTIFYFSKKNEAYDLYINFHADVSKKLVAMGDGTLLIDCHSFSNFPNRLNFNPPDIDICIGYNDDDTCPNNVTIGNIIHYFKSKGYKVGVNTPFSNSKTFSVPKEYHSVMIEVNKRLYMDELTYMKYDNFETVRNDIQSLYCRLLKS